MMIGEIYFCTLIYWLLALILIFPPEEAVSAGLIIENIFASWLGSETMSFVLYHMRRTSATIVVHSLLIPGYVYTIYNLYPWVDEYTSHLFSPHFFNVVICLSILPVIVALITVYFWSRNNWTNHPFSKSIGQYATTEELTTKIMISKVDSEFRRIENFNQHLSSISRIVVTDSYMLKITAYQVRFIPLKEAILVLESSHDAVQISNGGGSPAQYLQLRVSSIRQGFTPFQFRVNASSWDELSVKLINPVINSHQIVIHKSLSDRFLSVFEETILKNPKAVSEVELDLCIGCMHVKANVMLKRRCKDGDPNSECTTCSCRPMWCVPCLGKWFAARQDEKEPERWLSSRAPCPTCRSKFCLLDACVFE